ncbi:hypothetical protein QJS04_geneDACA023797 [Acorus gramineus]|uniref:Uncharacterized protein n=1 Tax=Acorus gramineus TaxID=55184 RepID=A0AAV9A1V9_ACOGR|nr:hypothetical protein QJS04_geneDACA023797 [Acorus gramineus]
MRRITTWNEASIGARFWEVVANHHSLWVQWMRKKYFKSKNIWSISIKSSQSWIWNRLLKARRWIKPDVSYVIFEGKSISLWFDPWLQGKCLHEHFNESVLLNWGPPDQDTVSALIRDGKWFKPPRWPIEFEGIWEEILMLDVGGLGEDVIIWTGHKTGSISSSLAWNHLRPSCPKSRLV